MGRSAHGRSRTSAKHVEAKGAGGENNGTWFRLTLTGRRWTLAIELRAWTSRDFCSGEKNKRHTENLNQQHLKTSRKDLLHKQSQNWKLARVCMDYMHTQATWLKKLAFSDLAIKPFFKCIFVTLVIICLLHFCFHLPSTFTKQLPIIMI